MKGFGRGLLLIQRHIVTGKWPIKSSKAKPKLTNHTLHRQSTEPIKTQGKYSLHVAIHEGHIADIKRGKTFISRDKTVMSR